MKPITKMKIWDFIGGMIGLFLTLGIVYMFVGYLFGMAFEEKIEECEFSNVATYNKVAFFWPKHFWAEKRWYCED